MNEEIRWLVNDRKVDDLREQMIEARSSFRRKNPDATEESENRYLERKFNQDSKKLMKEQLSIVASGLRNIA